MNKNFNINKAIYLNNLKNQFNSSLEVLNSIKKNFNNLSISLNGVKKQNYMDFIKSINTLKSKYLEIICLLLSDAAYIKPINLIKKELDDSYHIIFDKEKKNPEYNITFHCLAKQFYCSRIINIFKLDKNSCIKEDHNYNLSMIIDLHNSQDVIINLNLIED